MISFMAATNLQNLTHTTLERRTFMLNRKGFR